MTKLSIKTRLLLMIIGVLLMAAAIFSRIEAHMENELQRRPARMEARAARQ